MPALTSRGRVRREAGTTYTVSVYTTVTPTPRLLVQSPAYNRTTFRSELGVAVDYYFMRGGSIDGAIALYRAATGAAPLFGKCVGKLQFLPTMHL